MVAWAWTRLVKALWEALPIRTWVLNPRQAGAGCTSTHIFLLHACSKAPLLHMLDTRRPGKPLEYPFIIPSNSTRKSWRAMHQLQ